MRLHELEFPNPLLSPAGPIIVVQGQVFKLRLVNISNMDPKRRAQIDKPGMISREGGFNSDEFEFYSRRSGIINITFLVAHAEYLTLGRTEIQIAIMAGGQSSD